MDTENLAVIWSSGDPQVAHTVCFMYTHNAKRHGWFKNVTLIIWGPSAHLLANDTGLQDRIREMAADGVVIQACRACADIYGVSENLSELGVDVKYMGTPLTEILKGDWATLTF